MITAALDRVTPAIQHVSSTSAVASWLAALEATVHADRGDHAVARHALDRAYAALSQSTGHLTQASSYDSSTTNLAVATGHVLLKAGDYHGARTTLAAALDQSSPTLRRQPVLALVDFAIAELHSANLSTACSQAMKAAKSMHEAAYAVGASRLRAFRAIAERLLNSNRLRALDEQLTRIAA